MYDQISHQPTIVLHGTSATVFGAVGTSVPVDARMGLAESVAIAALAGGRQQPTRPEPRPIATRSLRLAAAFR